MGKNGLLSCYLFVGEDSLKRGFLLERMRNRVAALGDLEFNQDVFLGEAASGEDIVAACLTFPMMSDVRLVVVKDADKLSSTAREALVKYLEAPAETTVLVLSAAKLDKKTRLYKAIAKIDKKAVVACDPKKARDLPSQVRDFAVAHRVTISIPAAEALVARVGESTVRLDTEITKLAHLVGEGQEITLACVEANVERTAEVKPWELVDALADRNPQKCAVLFARLNNDKPFGELTMCVRRLRELLITKELQAQGRGYELAGALKKQDWQVRNYTRQASNFTTKELEDALIAAAALDQKMKSGYDPKIYFEHWLLSCARRS